MALNIASKEDWYCTAGLVCSVLVFEVGAVFSGREVPWFWSANFFCWYL